MSVRVARSLAGAHSKTAGFSQVAAGHVASMYSHTARAGSDGV